MENAEINNLIKIVGLQYKKNYSDPESLKTLRYGKIMIMTDQVCQQFNYRITVWRDDLNLVLCSLFARFYVVLVFNLISLHIYIS